MEYRVLVDFPSWEVGAGGVVRNTKTKRVKWAETHKGYLRVEFSVRGKRTRRMVHRLVADVFIPNPQALVSVNHINGDKQDNRAENLEWLSLADNTRHGQVTGLIPKLKCAYATQLHNPRTGMGLVCFGHRDLPPPLTAPEVTNCINRPLRNQSARGWLIDMLPLAEPIWW